MTDEIVQRLRHKIDAAAAQLVGRRHLVELVYLALVAREHLLFIGPPGTGKSAAVRLAASGVGGRGFEYLIGRFTEPSEIFGPLDLEALRQGRLRPDVTGMLPEADFAFLDEIFLGSTAILNALLTVLNERRYRRGHYDAAVPLRCCVGASNGMPDDPMLQAFADRFLVTAFVDPLDDDQLEALLAEGWRTSVAAEGEPAPVLALTDLDALAVAASNVDLAGTRAAYATIVRKLRARGVPLSDRRIVKGQKLVAAAALLAGRTAASEADLWPLVFIVQDRAMQDEVRDLLRSELAASASPVLPEAAKAAGYGPAARIIDLVAQAGSLAASMPDRSDAGFEPWLVRAEAFLAQLDAGFAAAARPAELTAARADLVARCTAPAAAA